jgi:phosphatidylserine decarboxylase
VLPHIKSFVATYNLPLADLLIEDLSQYPVSRVIPSGALVHSPGLSLICHCLTPTLPKTFNSFFARRLKASARPIDSPQDPTVIVSPADCRMTVFENVEQAKKFWLVLLLLASRGNQLYCPCTLLATRVTGSKADNSVFPSC